MHSNILHFNDVLWASPAIPFFVQPFVQAFIEFRITATSLERRGSQITGNNIVCSTVCLSIHQKHQIPRYWPFVKGIHQWTVNSLHKGPVTWAAQSHYLNQCWNIVNCTLGNKRRRNFNRNQHIFIQENAFENVICEMAASLTRPQYVNTIPYQINGTRLNLCCPHHVCCWPGDSRSLDISR